jgi:hypothetical protein
VHEQVVMAAEEDAIVEVGVAGVAVPVVDVVCFCEGGWSFAVGEAASTIPRREADALAWGEEPLVPTDVDDLSVGVEEHWYDACLAGVSGRGGDGYGIRLSFEAGSAGATLEIAGGDVEPNRNSAGAEYGAGVGEGGDSDEVDEGIDGDLLKSA